MKNRERVRKDDISFVFSVDCFDFIMSTNDNMHSSDKKTSYLLVHKSILLTFLQKYFQFFIRFYLNLNSMPLDQMIQFVKKLQESG